MHTKFLKLWPLALLQIVIVGNLQVLPANSVYGFSLPFLYLLAVIGFYIPCCLMVAELATTRPQTGGAYIWCEQAFGPKIGFFSTCLLWLSNLLWYPSIFALITSNFAYLFDASLAQNKIFIIAFGACLFWLLTVLNCIGVRFSSHISVICSVLGIIMPMLLIIAGGVYWVMSAKPLAASLTESALLPNIFHLDNLGFLIAIVISLFGVELTAVHAGNVNNPRREYPRSLLISGIIVIALLLFSQMSIAIIIPAAKLSVVTGLLDALMLFFQSTYFADWIRPVLLLVFIGNVGSVAAWMMGSSRGMYVACQKNAVAKFLQKTNKFEAPIGVLVFEAVIFTLVSAVFLIFPNVMDSFWLLLVLASQITLIYYIILFISAIRLRYLPVLAKGFIIPGGNAVLWLIMSLGIFTSLLAFLVGFIPPDNIDQQSIFAFHLIMSLGLIVVVCLPFLLLILKKRR